MEPVPTTHDTPSTLGSSPAVRATRHPLFYSDHLVFRVEGTLCKVPRQNFEEDSQIFKGMLAVGSGDTPAEGTSDDRPIGLRGIKLADFECLLRVMFKPFHDPSAEQAKPLTVDQWISVLDLTTMWKFHRLRRVATDNLTPLLRDDPIRWILLTRKYQVQEWLLPSLHVLARRRQAIQLTEVDSLGIETVVKMANVRESYTGGTNNGWGQSGLNRSQFNFEAQIRKLFEQELRAMNGSPGLLRDVVEAA